MSFGREASAFTTRAPVTARLCGLLLVAMTTACGGPSAVVAPTVPPALTGVGIGGLPGLLQIGQSVQLRAFAAFSDGTTMPVTSGATFTSIRPAIATVSAQGLLTAVSAGQGLVRIDYQTASGQWVVDVAGPTAGPDVSGFVHENNPLQVCLAGARVEVADGSAAGRVAMADNDGRFVFPGLRSAGFTLLASRPGYAPARVPVTEYPRDASADIAMSPTARVVDRVWDGTFAPDQCGLPNHADGQRSLFFTASADGILTLYRVQMNVVDVGGYDMRRGSDVLPVECPGRSGALRAVYSVIRGVEYELRVRGYGCGPNGPYDGSFHVEFSRPE